MRIWYACLVGSTLEVVANGVDITVVLGGEAGIWGCGGWARVDG